ncbi:MAG: EVE domain-containing protein [Candidatus Berkiella sp.]
MRQCWIGTVSKEHVQRGQAGGFAQVCHGKLGPLKRMKPGDFLIYYSPNKQFGEKTPYQCFSALGVIQEGEPYAVKMSEDFIPYRINVQYLNTQDTPIRPLLPQLSFIKDKTKWGAAFRFGILKIPCEDFKIIATAMGITNEEINELWL